MTRAHEIRGPDLVGGLASFSWSIPAVVGSLAWALTLMEDA